MSRSLIFPSCVFRVFDGEAYGIGGIPSNGCLIHVTRDRYRVDFISSTLTDLDYLVDENENPIEFNDGKKSVLGEKPALIKGEDYTDVAFFTSGAQVLYVESEGGDFAILSDESGSHRYDDDLLVKVHEKGVFIAESIADEAVFGIKSGKMIWEVPFNPPQRFNGVYPPFRQHHFYLCENKRLQCYNYHGGQLAWQHPLAELPLTLLEFDRRTVIQTPSEVISFAADGKVLGQKAMAGGGDMHTGNHLLGNDHLYLYVADREAGALVVYDYALQEQHRVALPENYRASFQRVSPELNVLSLKRVKKRIIGSKQATFWHPDDTLTLTSLLSEEDNYRVERVEQGGKSSYDVYIDSDNKHDFFRLADVIVLDVANKYGDDYCDPDVDRQFAGDIRLIVNDTLYQQERDFLTTMQQRLVNIIKENGGVMNSGVVSGDKQRHIDVQIVANADA